MTRPLSLLLYGTLILVGLAAILLGYALGEAVVCYNSATHSLLLFHETRAGAWEFCARQHLYFPFSFF